jgi:hypothetical protein
VTIHTIRALLEDHYRNEDLIEVLTQDVRALDVQIAALREWIASDSTYPSQGVPAYQPSTGRRGGVSDPTSHAAHLHTRNVADVSRELKELERRRTVNCYALGLALARVSALRVVLERLAPLDRMVVQMRWGRVRHGKRPTLEEIATACDVDTATVKRHVARLSDILPLALAELRG